MSVIATRDPAPFTIQYLRLPNRRSAYQSQLLHTSPSTLVLAHTLDSAPSSSQADLTWEVGDLLIWFLFKGEPYDVARVHGRDGQLKGFYADALEPVFWDGDDATSLTPLVDLCLDLWIDPSGACAVLDQDELEEAYANGWMTVDQHLLSTATIRDLVRRTKAGAFPPQLVRTFDPASGLASESDEMD